MTASPTMRTDCATLPGRLDFDFDDAGAVHPHALPAAEHDAAIFRCHQSVLHEIHAQHAVGIAADRVLGDAERRHEHSRLGADDAIVLGEREHEITFGADVRREPCELLEIRLDRAEQLRGLQADQQSRAALGEDLQRAVDVQARAGDAERVQHLAAVMIRQDRAERRRVLSDADAQVAVDFRHLDLDDAGAGALAQLAARLAVLLRAHVLRGDGRVADERHRMPRREELDLHVVIAGFRFQHERRLAVHFSGDCLHLIFRQLVGVQHDDRGIAAEALARERVDVKEPAAAIGHES